MDIKKLLRVEIESSNARIKALEEELASEKERKDRIFAELAKVEKDQSEL